MTGGDDDVAIAVVVLRHFRREGTGAVTNAAEATFEVMTHFGGVA